ncbi:MraY family glycosyltransferase [uncultured Gimesia sp.]|jgi:UDP-GlcNAc:undecaprenyl-phosphate/decaprenyl-phosphate GlcNAc-1-phosphate transferase|uniref:MraY family glycosyltransferase n=1 Tax=uncultured Gimesia sp. TaxID=1678688 RepID=UPI00262C3C2A|nr:MraY family glycosyltransferase [uncultured Gimesia sp.]
MLFFVIACLVPSFLISFLATGAMRKLAPKWGLIDQPAQRKVHINPTPLGGGVGIWLGVILPIAVAQLTVLVIVKSGATPTWIPQELVPHLEGVLYRSGQLWAVLAGGTVLAVMGLLDDKLNISWKPRLVIQLLVAFGLVLAGVRGTLFIQQPWIGILLTVVWIIVLVNSLNFLDNMDGLTSGIGLIAAVLFALIMLRFTGEPRWLVAGVLLVLAGSIAGFLCHNWPPAKIFMGDSGSYFIGLILSTMTILGTFYPGDLPEGASVASRHVILAPLCILAIPLYDFCTVMIIRLKEGRSPFHADKSHFSHRLVELGLSKRDTVLTIHLATLTTGVGGLILYEVSSWSAALLVILMILCVLSIVTILENVGRKNRE